MPRGKSFEICRHIFQSLSQPHLRWHRRSSSLPTRQATIWVDFHLQVLCKKWTVKFLFRVFIMCHVLYGPSSSSWCVTVLVTVVSLLFLVTNTMAIANWRLRTDEADAKMATWTQDEAKGHFLIGVFAITNIMLQVNSSFLKGYEVVLKIFFFFLTFQSVSLHDGIHNLFVRDESWCWWTKTDRNTNSEAIKCIFGPSLLFDWFQHDCCIFCYVFPPIIHLWGRVVAYH